jgi:hypothetical protein
MKLKSLYLMLTMFLVVLIGGCKKDEDPAVRPVVTSTTPSNNAIDVALDATISFTFNVAMEASTITNANFTLKQGNATVPGTTSQTGLTASFVPEALLLPSTEYTATISMAVRNTSGTGLSKPHVWKFTTAGPVDSLFPTVNSTSPVNNATGISRNNNIGLTFSEAMDPLTVNSTTFTVKQGETPVAGTVTYNGNTGTFNPTTALSANTTYTATVNTSAKDLAGNPLQSNKVWEFTTGGSSTSLAVVNLGTSGNYVILAQSAINNSSTSAITGDLAISPAATSYITGLALTDATGYATSSQVTGNIYAADMADPTPINLTTAVGDMITAYNDAAGRPSPDFLELATGDLGGLTLIPGLYKWTSSVTIPTALKISGGANDVWIFQISGDLTMAKDVIITLEGEAQAKNIFWQVAGQATLGTTTHFEGIILSKTGITLQTGASLNGRTLAQTAVVLDSNAVTKPE